MKIKRALIGYSGFVGGNLVNQIDFADLYNSKNIDLIKGKSYDEIYCAGASAVKYLANLNPSNDLYNITNLIDNLREVKTENIILLSTIDIYKNLDNVDENIKITLNNHHAYGTHRRLLEVFIKERFVNSLIVRLPGLFGDGLKKNIIYDFLHNNEVEKIDSRNIFQFYNLNNLSKDINIALKNNLSIINLATEPISVKEIAKVAFGLDFTNITTTNTISYNMTSKYANLYGKNGKYIYNKNEVLADIKAYVKKESK